MPSTCQCHTLCTHTGINVIMHPSMAALSHTWTLHHTRHAQGKCCQVRASFGNSITVCTDGGSFITNNNGARQNRTLNVKRQVKQGMVSQLASLLFTQTVWQGVNVSFCQSCPPWSKTRQSGLSELSPSSCSAFTKSILFIKHVRFLYKYGQLSHFYTMQCNTCSDVSERIGSGGCWSDEGEENMFVMLKGWKESGHTNTHKQKSTWEARTSPDGQMWQLWACGRLHSWL